MIDLHDLLQALIDGDVTVEVTIRIVVDRRDEKPYTAHCNICGWSNRYKHSTSRRRAMLNHAKECPGLKRSNAKRLSRAKR